jgi:TolB-like protein/DNA-binding winged helix-turn-helix (wHTH) protein
LATRLIKFDAFELDCDRYQLSREGRSLKLEKLPMDLLILLATKDGRLVTRTEIVECLWGADVFVDSEHGINTAIRKVRQALRDDPESPRFIETVHGRGYRFVAPATEINPLPAIPQESIADSAVADPPRREPESEAPAPDRPFEPEPLPKRNRRPWVVGGLLAVAALAIAATSLGWRRFVVRAAPSPIQSLAVIPLENLSGDPNQEYFADEMTDELITMLAKNSSLRLVSRTSVMQYKGVHRPLPEIAKALGVDGILEGSIARSGDKIHMNMQLIQAPSDTHLWAESYDRSSKDLPSLPRDAALTIAARLHSSVPHSAAQRSVKPEAHEAYLRGRYYWFAENSEDIEYLKKATELQPDYALAWSGLADAYARSAIHGIGRRSDLAPLEEEAARRTLELDDSLPDAHNTMAGNYLFFHWDPAKALKESDRAIELNPQYAEAYFLRSIIFQTLNRQDDALDAVKRSTELDPFARPFSMPQLLTRIRNYDAAIREAQARLVAQPNDLGLHFELALAYQCKGLEQEAARETEKVTLLDEGEANAAAVRRAFERGGYLAILELQLNDLKREAAHQYVAPLNFAFAYARLRRKDETLHFAEEAYREHAPALVWIQNWPEWDFLHSDERYRSIVRRMGLPPAW